MENNNTQHGFHHYTMCDIVKSKLLFQPDFWNIFRNIFDKPTQSSFLTTEFFWKVILLIKLKKYITKSSYGKLNKAPPLITYLWQVWTQNLKSKRWVMVILFFSQTVYFCWIDNRQHQLKYNNFVTESQLTCQRVIPWPHTMTKLRWKAFYPSVHCDL